MLDGLLADTAPLTEVPASPRGSGRDDAAEALIGQRVRVPTLPGGFIRVKGTGGGVHLKGNVGRTTRDGRASHGVVDISDRVLLPH